LNPRKALENMLRDRQIYGFSEEKDGTFVVMVPDDMDASVFEALDVEIKLVRMREVPRAL
jgi:hypothetical protein